MEITEEKPLRMVDIYPRNWFEEILLPIEKRSITQRLSEGRISEQEAQTELAFLQSCLKN